METNLECVQDDRIGCVGYPLTCRLVIVTCGRLAILCENDILLVKQKGEMLQWG